MLHTGRRRASRIASVVQKTSGIVGREQLPHHVVVRDESARGDVAIGWFHLGDELGTVVIEIRMVSRM